LDSTAMWYTSPVWSRTYPTKMQCLLWSASFAIVFIFVLMVPASPQVHRWFAKSGSLPHQCTTQGFTSSSSSIWTNPSNSVAVLKASWNSLHQMCIFVTLAH
jgi:hypothetical protein